MNETTRITLHYLEQIVKRARLSGFDEMRAEFESADASDRAHEQKIIEDLERKIDHAQEMIDTPDWRDRR
jgi:hypothetical protein